MSKKIFLFAIIILSSSKIILSQVLKDDIIKGENLKHFVDSIKNKNLKDSAKIKIKYPIICDGERHITSNHSPLIIISNKQFFNVNCLTIKAFTIFQNEILNYQKIDSIVLIKSSKAIKLYGPDGVNGAILIQMKRNSKFPKRLSKIKSELMIRQ